MDNLRIILANIVPLLNGIHSLCFDLRALPTVQQCFANKLDKIKVLKIYGHGFELDEAAVQSMADVLLKWLLPAQEDDSNGPRYCKIVLPNALLEKILRAIRQEFLIAKTPRTFELVPYVDHWQSQLQFVEFHLQNNIGEELHGVKMEPGFLRITRHRANYNMELQAWIEANKAQTHHSQIRIFIPTIGLIDGMDAPGNAEDEDLQPSTSKKARIA